MELYKQIRSNKWKSFSMTLLVALLLMGIGVAVTFIWGQWGFLPVVIAFVVVVIMSIGSYWFSDRIALASAQAHEVSPDQAPQLHNIVEGLCIGAGMPKPRIYVCDDPAPNAFATGRNPDHAAIAVTTGLLALMNRDELEGVLAHELSHIRNYDILLQSMVVVMVGAIVMISNFFMYSLWFGGGRRSSNQGGNAGAILALVGLVLIILSPFAAKAIQLAVSRRRESLADVSGVEITRYPAGLRSALEKLQANPHAVKHASQATAHMWIESPLDNKDKEHPGRARLNRLFMTHPPLDERIEALKKLEMAGGQPPS